MDKIIIAQFKCGCCNKMIMLKNIVTQIKCRKCGYNYIITWTKPDNTGQFDTKAVSYRVYDEEGRELSNYQPII